MKGEASMNDVQIFSSSEFGDIRAVLIDSEPHFVAKDVAERLGYAKPRNAIYAHVDIEDKKVAPIQGILGGEQAVTVINESGLYSLVLSSKMPKAKEFKRWVTSEVLPSIRKHGAYATAQTIDNIIDDPEMGIKLLQALKKEREEKAMIQQQKEIAEQVAAKSKAELEKVKPDVEFAGMVQCSENEITLRDMAQLLSSSGWETGQNRFCDWLKKYGYIDTWNIPYQRYVDKGILVKRGFVIVINGKNVTKFTTRITGKGQKYFVGKFIELYGIPNKKPQYVEQEIFE